MAAPRRRQAPDRAALMRTRALDWIAYTLVTLYVLVATTLALWAALTRAGLPAGVVTVLRDLGEYVAMPTILGLAGMSAVTRIWGDGQAYVDPAAPSPAQGVMGGGATQNPPVAAPPQE